MRKQIPLSCDCKHSLVVPCIREMAISIIQSKSAENSKPNPLFLWKWNSDLKNKSYSWDSFFCSWGRATLDVLECKVHPVFQLFSAFFCLALLSCNIYWAKTTKKEKADDIRQNLDPESAYCSRVHTVSSYVILWVWGYSDRLITSPVLLFPNSKGQDNCINTCARIDIVRGNCRGVTGNIGHLGQS